MVTTLEYALLAQHVYNINKLLFGYKKSDNEITTKQITDKLYSKLTHRWMRAVDVNPHLIPSKHFYAQLYLKLFRGKITDAVVAYRGTVASDIDNFWVDIKSWCSDVEGDGKHDGLPEYYGRALHFFIKAKMYVRKNFPLIHFVNVTGHSLGGALAQLISTVAGYAVNTVSFNSPGIGHLPKVNHLAAKRIRNVNSRYGFVNKIGETLGNIVYVDVREAQWIAKEILSAYRESEHSPIINSFEAWKIIELAGLPTMYEQHRIANVVEAIRRDER